MIAFQLSAEAVIREGVPLLAEDLQYGLEHGFLNSESVIKLATFAVRDGTDDPVMQGLAALLSEEQDQVPGVLMALDDPERFHDPRDTARKWLFLELAAVYNDRGELADPLGLVEQLYADFDYPPAVAPFVRYMPLPLDAEHGQGPLLQRWREYLVSERTKLAAIS